MGRILVIPNSDFSRNRIVKVDIAKQVEGNIDNNVSYKTSTIIDNNSSSKKNNDQ